MKKGDANLHRPFLPVTFLVNPYCAASSAFLRVSKTLPRLSDFASLKSSCAAVKISFFLFVDMMFVAVFQFFESHQPA